MGRLRHYHFGERSRCTSGVVDMLFLSFRRAYFLTHFNTRIVLVIIAVLLSGQAWGQPFVMAFGENPEKNQQYRFYKEVYTRAFQRMGFEFSYVLCPSKRCSVMANSGKVGGEPQRIKEYGSFYSNMLRVDEAIFNNKVVAFALDKAWRLDGLESLRDAQVRVDYRLGSVWSKQQLSKVITADRLSAVHTFEQGLNRLLQNRTDVFVALEAPTMKVLQMPTFKNTAVMPIGVVGQNLSFPFIHNAYPNLPSRLAKVLKTMKKSGEYTDIFNQVLPYLDPQ